jgi:RsiW-degrading membrane proteinase PrsW (M82 family)
MGKFPTGFMRQEFSVDNGDGVALFFDAMAETEQKLTTPLSLLVDAILVIAFTVYMYTVCESHVPSNDKKMIFLWAGLTALLFGTLFWLALQMFRVVLRFQLEQRADLRRK